MTSDPIKHWEGRRTYWQHEASENERFRRICAWSPVVGVPLALVAALFHVLAGALVGVTTFLLVVLGIYMTTVRRYEFRANVEEAERELQTASQAPPS